MRVPLYRDQKKVNLLLQLVEPKEYEKFCGETIMVLINVLPREVEESIELGFEREQSEERKLNLSCHVKRIDDVLKHNRAVSIYSGD